LLFVWFWLCSGFGSGFGCCQVLIHVDDLLLLGSWFWF